MKRKKEDGMCVMDGQMDVCVISKYVKAKSCHLEIEMKKKQTKYVHRSKCTQNKVQLTHKIKCMKLYIMFEKEEQEHSSKEEESIDG